MSLLFGHVEPHQSLKVSGRLYMANDLNGHRIVPNATTTGLSAFMYIFSKSHTLAMHSIPLQ